MVVNAATGAGRRALARFQAEAEEADSLRLLAAIFSREVERFGITAYAIAHVIGGGRPTTIYLSTWPRAWMTLYAANGYIREDPILREALTTADPFTWAELMSRHDLNRNRVLGAAADFGFLDGFVVPVHAGETRGVISFVAARLRLDEDQREPLAERSRICHRIAQRLYDVRRPETIAMPPREREALSLVAQGLEDAAIAGVLGVTRSSAHVYVERAKRRLGASTRAQAVAMAAAEGLL